MRKSKRVRHVGITNKRSEKNFMEIIFSLHCRKEIRKLQKKKNYFSSMCLINNKFNENSLYSYCEKRNVFNENSFLLLFV